MNKTELISVNSRGDLALGNSSFPAVDKSGRYVAFVSSAPNLVEGDTNLADDIFVRDRKTGETGRVSVASSGAEAACISGCVDKPSFGPRGRYVAFPSAAANLVSGDTNRSWDVFVHDRKAGKTTRVSVASDGSEGDSYSGCSSMSADDRSVAFYSQAANLVADDSNLYADVFVHDLKTGKTELVSLASDGHQPTFGATTCGSYPGAISANGRYIAFYSIDDNMVPNDPTPALEQLDRSDVFVRDRHTERTRRVSVTSQGGEGHGESFQPFISGDGRYLAFTSAVNEFSSSDTGSGDCLVVCMGDLDVFVHDLTTGATEMVSIGSDGTEATCRTRPGGWTAGSTAGIGASVAGGGRFISFTSCAENFLPPGLATADGWLQIFVRDRGLVEGVGSLVASGRLSVEGAPAFTSTGMVASRDPASDVAGVLSDQGANFIGAGVVYRSAYRDLFVRLLLRDMPSVARLDSLGPVLLYGLDLVAEGTRYQVRVQRLPGPDFDESGGASFALFRRDSATGLYSKVAVLQGGYGTMGAEVVFSLPLTDLGLDHGGRLKNLEAFTAYGLYEQPVQVNDQILDRVTLGTHR